MRRKLLWLIVASLHPCAAFAADEPCREVQAGVLCTKDGFETLVAAALDSETNEQLCDARLKSCSAEQAELKQRIAQLLAQPCPPPPAPPHATAPSLGAGLMMVGVVASTAAPFLDQSAPSSLKLSLGLGGAIMAGLGVALSIPW